MKKIYSNAKRKCFFFATTQSFIFIHPICLSISPPISPPPHIMISYSWKTQTFAIDLATYLKGKGHTIWIDIEQMSGSTLEGMAKGVEGSELMILLICESYQTSPSCRCEGELAFLLRKPILPIMVGPDPTFRPSTWLKALLGTRLYFEMYDSFQHKLDRLAKIEAEIRRLIPSLQPNPSPSPSPSSSSSLSSSPSLSSSSTPSCSISSTAPIFDWEISKIQQKIYSHFYSESDPPDLKEISLFSKWITSISGKSLHSLWILSKSESNFNLLFQEIFPNLGIPHTHSLLLFSFLNSIDF